MNPNQPQPEAGQRRFADYDPMPMMAQRGRCDQCHEDGVVVYDIQNDRLFCSVECRRAYETALTGINVISVISP